jgi:hypothetical protein
MDEAQRRGRPRSQQTHDAILDAVRDLLLSGGYAQVAMDRVASLAGVGKQSLYRRWPSKAPLVAEAVMDAYGQHGPFELPDSGDIEADLRTWLHGQAAYLGSALQTIRSMAKRSTASSPDRIIRPYCADCMPVPKPLISGPTPTWRQSQRRSSAPRCTGSSHTSEPWRKPPNTSTGSSTLWFAGCGHSNNCQNALLIHSACSQRSAVRYRPRPPTSRHGF